MRNILKETTGDRRMTWRWFSEWNINVRWRRYDEKHSSSFHSFIVLISQKSFATTDYLGNVMNINFLEISTSIFHPNKRQDYFPSSTTLDWRFDYARTQWIFNLIRINGKFSKAWESHKVLWVRHSTHGLRSMNWQHISNNWMPFQWSHLCSLLILGSSSSLNFHFSWKMTSRKRKKNENLGHWMNENER